MTLLSRRGLLGSSIDLGLTVPQEVMLSVYREVTDRPGVAGQCQLAELEWGKLPLTQTRGSGFDILSGQFTNALINIFALNLAIQILAAARGAPKSTGKT